MIIAGVVAGVIAYYWLWPKAIARLIMRRVEAFNRAAQSHPTNGGNES